LPFGAFTASRAKLKRHSYSLPSAASAHSSGYHSTRAPPGERSALPERPTPSCGCRVGRPWARSCFTSSAAATKFLIVTRTPAPFHGLEQGLLQFHLGDFVSVMPQITVAALSVQRGPPRSRVAFQKASPDLDFVLSENWPRYSDSRIDVWMMSGPAIPVLGEPMAFRKLFAPRSVPRDFKTRFPASLTIRPNS
jgi:hypothetical protein